MIPSNGRVSDSGFPVSMAGIIIIIVNKGVL